jgi:molecular chaperone GrpE
MTHKDHKKKPDKAHEDEASKEEVSTWGDMPKKEATASGTDLAQQAGEYLAGWQRAQADYQNLKRDTAKRVSDITKYANEDLLTQFLPIIDYFTYAFKGVPENERNSSWLKGVEHIQTNFIRVLEDNGVNKIKTVGEMFDASMHESLETVEGTDKEHGIIVEEVAPGFTLNGKVIRSAKVKIAK